MNHFERHFRANKRERKIFKQIIDMILGSENERYNNKTKEVTERESHNDNLTSRFEQKNCSFDASKDIATLGHTVFNIRLLSCLGRVMTTHKSFVISVSMHSENALLAKMKMIRPMWCKMTLNDLIDGFGRLTLLMRTKTHIHTGAIQLHDEMVSL